MYGLDDKTTRERHNLFGADPRILRKEPKLLCGNGSETLAWTTSFLSRCEFGGFDLSGQRLESNIRGQFAPYIHTLRRLEPTLTVLQVFLMSPTCADIGSYILTLPSMSAAFRFYALVESSPNHLRRLIKEGSTSFSIPVVCVQMHEVYVHKYLASGGAVLGLRQFGAAMDSDTLPLPAIQSEPELIHFDEDTVIADGHYYVLHRTFAEPSFDAFYVHNEDVYIVKILRRSSEIRAAALDRLYTMLTRSPSLSGRAPWTFNFVFVVQVGILEYIMVGRDDIKDAGEVLPWRSRFHRYVLELDAGHLSRLDQIGVKSKLGKPRKGQLDF